jgi:hypothetical protein
MLIERQERANFWKHKNNSKIWYLYKNNYNIGQAKGFTEAQKRIETIANQDSPEVIRVWEIGKDFIRYGEYHATLEELK